MNRQFARVVWACACFLTTVGALFAQPAPAASPAVQRDDASQGSTDVDRTVAYPMTQVLAAARQALAMYRCDNKKEERPGYVECAIDGRNEKVSVQFNGEGSETRVEIKTVKNHWFELQKTKNWSTPIFDAMMVALEQPPDPARGARVRVTTAGAASQRLTGNILTVDEETLTMIDEDGQRVKVSRELIARLDKSVSRKRHALHGLLIGAAAGGVIGALPCGAGLCFTGGKGPAALWAVVFGGVGATLGHLVRTDKWAEMPLDRVRVGLRPAASGRGGGLTLTFAF